jgi:hypothetical protein
VYLNSLFEGLFAFGILGVILGEIVELLDQFFKLDFAMLLNI